MEGLTEGRMVHYVLPSRSRHAGEHRPAVVVKVWRMPDGSAQTSGCANLQVFTDFSNDFSEAPGEDGRLWATSVVCDPEGAPGTWHWIERA